MKKIFCFAVPDVGNDKKDVMAIAISDDGFVLVQHISSNDEWAKTDLGLRGAGHYTKKYDEVYGVGNWELEWVDNPKDHPGCAEAIRIQRERADKLRSESN